jgi:hypothetical protein
MLQTESRLQRNPSRAWALVLLLGTIAGYQMSPSPSLAAQRGGAEPWKPTWQTPVPAPSLPAGARTMWPQQPKAAMHWSIDDVKKAHQALANAEIGGKSVDPNSVLHDFPYWTRTHAMFIQHVSQSSSGDTAQQHLGYAQFIVIMGGTGTAVAGGELRSAQTLVEQGRQVPGELRGRTVAGGDTFQLNEGDLLSIPPNTPVQFKATSRGGLTYMVTKLNAMVYPWELIR